MTSYRRNVKGNVVHRFDCPQLSARSTQPAWEAVEGFTARQLDRLAAILGVRPCRHCRPMQEGAVLGLRSAPVEDEVAVQVAMQGRGHAVRPAERAEAVRRMTEHGAMPHVIAERLGVSRRTVHRIQRWLRETAS